MWKLAKRTDVCLLLSTSLVLITIYNQTSPQLATSVKDPLPKTILNPLLVQIQENEQAEYDSAIHSEKNNSRVYEKKTAVDDNMKLPWWDGGDCACNGEGECIPQFPSMETFLPPRLIHTSGPCGRRAGADGGRQKIISFTLFGDNPSYWTGLSETLSTIKLLYPGWKVWLYTDPRGRSAILCPLLRYHNHFRVCDVTNLPRPLYNISRVLPTMWRIAPLGDPTVDVLVVRDTDSMFTEREKYAVQEWLVSGKMFHVMRDHPAHKAYVLAGMWGARWDIQPRNNSSRAPTRKDLEDIRNKMLKMAFNQDDLSLDQVIMRRELWPEMVGFVLSHDSFFCKTFPSGWRPWPTKRTNGTFVGNTRFCFEKADKPFGAECPSACRPPEHQDWVSC